MTTLLSCLTAALLAGLALAAPAAGQTCPWTPDDAYAFINAGSGECPADPEVFWHNATVEFDCSFFAAAGTAIDCGSDGHACVELCQQAAGTWNTDLPGRFTFVDAGNTVSFCDPNDGKVSIGGTSMTLCDGKSLYASNVLAVTLSIFYTGGSQSGHLIDANITVNQAFQFSPASFRATLAHELGHVLGLSHPDECGDDYNVLMRSASLFPPQSLCFVRDPTAADIRGAERIYPLVGPTPGLCGDADLSGAVTVSDGVQVLRAAAGLSSACTPQRCDVDGSGEITVTDGVHVLRTAAGLPSISACP